MSWGKLYIGNKGYIPALQVNKDGNPVGTVITFAGTTAPQGYLLCDGRAVSRTVYSELFSVIGTTYGPGDGSSSFNLPDIIDRFIQGKNTGLYHEPGLPNITGILDTGDRRWNTSALSGAFYGTNGSANKYTDQVSTTTTQIGAFDASRSSSIYGNSTTVQPKSIELYFYIKY